MRRYHTIVSKDEDFHHLSFLDGAPPKGVWVRLGNCTTAAIEQALRRHYTDLLNFDANEEGAFLIVGIKEDLAQVLEQTRATTRISEAIRSEVSRSHTVSTADLEYRKQQLAEFYGPIYAYLKLSAELYRLWIDGKLQEINDDILRLFLDQNDKIEAIITTKAHLIEGGEIAEVFTRFMTSASIFNFYTARPGQNTVPDDVASLPESKWPQEFQKYIYETTEQLKQELDRLYREHRIASSGTEIA